jgi:hypothetical protein
MAYPSRGPGGCSNPITLSIEDERAARMRNAVAAGIVAASLGVPPATATGPRRRAPSLHSDIDANWPVRVPIYEAVYCLNFCGLPFVAFASSAVEASGVSIPGTASATSAAASRTRSLSSRFSFRVYCPCETSASAPVISNPRITMRTGSHNNQRGELRRRSDGERSAASFASAL